MTNLLCVLFGIRTVRQIAEVRQSRDERVFTAVTQPRPVVSSQPDYATYAAGWPVTETAIRN